MKPFWRDVFVVGDRDCIRFGGFQVWSEQSQLLDLRVIFELLAISQEPRRRHRLDTNSSCPLCWHPLLYSASFSQIALHCFGVKPLRATFSVLRIDTKTNERKEERDQLDEKSMKRLCPVALGWNWGRHLCGSRPIFRYAQTGVYSLWRETIKQVQGKGTNFAFLRGSG